jgi:hypothetical protein
VEEEEDAVEEDDRIGGLLVVFTTTTARTWDHTADYEGRRVVANTICVRMS